ncbi:MAG: CRISPR-associated endonuclease Cas2 [Thermoanaerobaculia bacterium]
MNILEISRWLNQSRLSAAPCPWLSAVSIFVDERYENYDYDIIGPRARLRIAKVLLDHDFRQLSGRVFEGPLGRIEFPQPSRSLATDPSEELERVVDRSVGGVFATPTQIVLTTWRREGPEIAPSRQQDLLKLVREQPANLGKIRDWLRRTPSRADFQRIRSRLEAAQEDGLQQRRRGNFRTQLPR